MMKKLLLYGLALLLPLIFLSCEQNTTSKVDTNAAVPKQSLKLEAGWNCASFYVKPVTDSIQDVFRPIEQDFNVIESGQGGKGGIWFPDQEKNTIGPYATNKGYLINVKQPTVLEVVGALTLLDSIPLDAKMEEDCPNRRGYFPIPGDQAIAPSQLIFGKENNLYFIHDYRGGTYWPEYGINDIGMLYPGKSYLFVFNDADYMKVMKGAAKDSLKAESLIPSVDLPDSWEVRNYSPFLSLLLIPNNLFTKPAKGDYLAVFREDNFCAGVDAVRVDEKYSVLIMYANDGITDEVDGMRKDDPIVLKYFSATTNAVEEFEVFYKEGEAATFRNWTGREVGRLVKK